jgi:hypothetical protein
MSNFFDILMSSGIMEQIANVDTFSLMNSTGPLPEPITNMTNSLTNLFISSYSNDIDSNEPIQVRLNNIKSRLQENKDQSINHPLYVLGNIIYSSKFTRTSSYPNNTGSNTSD